MIAPNRIGADHLGWHLRRLRRMSAGEVCSRIENRARQALWSRRRFETPPLVSGAHTAGGMEEVSLRVPTLPATLDLSGLGQVACREVLAAADALLAGQATFLGTLRTDMLDPAWSFDPTSGRSFPDDLFAFRVDYRKVTDPRSVKHVWELSRHQYLAVLALAWQLSGDERYASMVADHLRSWWSRNPVLTGVNWTSGIELGLRLISWVWTRRLLTGWARVSSLFEGNEVAVGQVYWHQRYLATFPSRGSSANNHVIAEAVGQLVASHAFPWFAESARWAEQAAALLESELSRNTFPDGVNREQAFEYHGLVAELALVATAEAEASGAPLPQSVLDLLCKMLDVIAAVCDRTGRPPRYGDADDGRALVLTAPTRDRWQSLLATGASVFGPQPWWPATTSDTQSLTLGAMVGRRIPVAPRPSERPSHFPAAGLTILRTPPSGSDELWCRCDGGPHGFLSIAAHAHADALSIEVRHDGTELLVDPGTYCYQGNPVWRTYFRSTLAHNTIELDGQNQSMPGGPFLWTKRAETQVLDATASGDGWQRWSAEHDGYLRLAAPARHRREVHLDPLDRALEIVDQLTSDNIHVVRLAFHLGPSLESRLDGHRATLTWARPHGASMTASLTLAPELTWTEHRGATNPPLGWYSPCFGAKMPITTLVGTGRIASGEFRSRLQVIAATKISTDREEGRGG